MPSSAHYGSVKIWCLLVLVLKNVRQLHDRAKPGQSVVQSHRVKPACMHSLMQLALHITSAEDGSPQENLSYPVQWVKVPLHMLQNSRALDSPLRESQKLLLKGVASGRTDL